MQVIEVLRLEAPAKLNRALCLLKLGDPHACIQVAQEVGLSCINIAADLSSNLDTQVAFGPASLPSRVSGLITSYLEHIPQNLKVTNGLPLAI